MLFTYNLYVREPEMSPETVVREFCSAVSERDPDLLRTLLAPAVVYQNVGVGTSDGIEATIENVAGQWAMFPERYEFEVVHLAASGNVVLTERIDYVGPGGGAPIAPVPVMGRFEVEDERIIRWYDYFDQALVGKMFAGDDLQGLTPA
jgi:limonene-1,2-epoxide hydrolase